MIFSRLFNISRDRCATYPFVAPPTAKVQDQSEDGNHQEQASRPPRTEIVSLFAITVLCAKRLPLNPNRKCAPVVHMLFTMPGYRSQHAKTQKRQTNWPIWQEQFIFSVDPSAKISEGMVHILLEDSSQHKKLGEFWVSLESIMQDGSSTRKFSLGSDDSMSEPSISVAFDTLTEKKSKSHMVSHRKNVYSVLPATLSSSDEEKRHLGAGLFTLLQIAQSSAED
ncbi:hypothetical protein GUITHDRAFT_153928 [Guillardia theta CCMP2712]|uniref:C2 domain-containing protein n=1 Tax=Guillardia theta (strain CCMP2712) TaxID=905079 RepID=L1IYX6_GUITC|nr:hypothetical protein GUITHDRAFT_153928 [Guillardia theta CCMP2712]EKX41109.1 hypothetical protein GUITHDRAFT_153928 [Guillardia theta CCMP2712]|eukprot:XP_005828089.1 hypothetical protein GUITHDRAFT_153928 [Guillardia theta CCMP2712]